VDDFRHVSAALARCRRLLDLDADPEAVVEALSSDDDLRSFMAKAPGQRIPRTGRRAGAGAPSGARPAVSIKAARNPDAFPATDLGVRLTTKQLRLPEDSRAPHGAELRLAPMAVLRHTASVDCARPPPQCLATRR
jgi:3-methyladenine DNA glycosylase/8-oxoguanine DNA glycosylase